MTREEAKDLLDNLIGMVEDNHKSDYDTALRMGIKALEQEPCKDWHDVPSDEMTIEQARQAVKDLRKKLDKYSWEMSLIKRKIEEMPPATPAVCIAKITFNKDDLQKLVDEKVKEIVVERKKGKWIKEYDNSALDGLYYCSVCGRKLWIHNEESVSDYPYCHCGAEMESEE